MIGQFREFYTDPRMAELDRIITATPKAEESRSPGNKKTSRQTRAESMRRIWAARRAAQMEAAR